MSAWRRWLVGTLAFNGISGLIMGGVGLVLPQSITDHAQEVAQLRVATANTLNERDTRVLLEGRVGDRMAFSDRPPLVAYNEYHSGDGKENVVRSYAPTLWVQIPGKEVEVTAGYRMRATPSWLDEGINRSYGGFEVNDPVLVLGTLSVIGDRPVVSEAEIAFETKEAYLVSLEREQSLTRELNLLLLVAGSLMALGGGVAYLVWRGDTNFSSVP